MLAPRHLLQQFLAALAPFLAPLLAALLLASPRSLVTIRPSGDAESFTLILVLVVKPTGSLGRPVTEKV